MSNIFSVSIVQWSHLTFDLRGKLEHYFRSSFYTQSEMSLLLVFLLFGYVKRICISKTLYKLFFPILYLLLHRQTLFTDFRVNRESGVLILRIHLTCVV